MIDVEIPKGKVLENLSMLNESEKIYEDLEISNEVEPSGLNKIEQPDILYIERTSRTVLIESTFLNAMENDAINIENTKITEGLTEDEKIKIKEETGWSDDIIENIKNMDQYEILKNANLIEIEINGKKCLIKEDIDLDYTDKDGISNRDRIRRGLAPLDSKSGKPIELHHLGQKVDSPLVELTEEEHRTGGYKDGLKNQSLWHDNTITTEVHGEGNYWDKERNKHWKARANMMEGE